MRRVERLILGSPIVLRAVASLTMHGRKDSKPVLDWVARFVPMLRYGNPGLSYEFKSIRGQHQGLEAPGDPEGAEDLEKTNLSATATAEELEHREHIKITFSDGSSDMLNLELYQHSHQIMQQILELDMEKSATSGIG
mmetsp:Transcript_1030/g.1921  ORF Transcript_1030/g.1921 Transcript_1030/m.1921 type:complete len:138 (-) Transcript_1030:64-477(-)